MHDLGSAPTWREVFLACPAPYRLGYSGTPFRVRPGRSGFSADDLWLLGLCGPPIVEIPSSFLREECHLSQARVPMIRVSEPWLWKLRDWRTVYWQGIVRNEARTHLIVETTRRLVARGGKVLLLVRLLSHGKYLRPFVMPEFRRSSASAAGRPCALP